MSTRSKTALITGASSGIGWELALLAAKEHSHLVLIARNTPKLKELEAKIKKHLNATVTIITADLSEVSAVETILSHLRKKKIEITTLINNAGFGGHGLYHLREWQAEAEMIQVNVVVVAELTKKLLPPMIKAQRGHILNVASVAGFLPGPFMAVYYATKAFVLSFSEALAEELEGTGVSVTVLCPGPTHTGFAKQAGLEHSLLFQKTSMTVQEVAQAGYQGMKQQQRIVIPGNLNKLQVFSLRFLPRFIITKMVARIQKQ